MKTLTATPDPQRPRNAATWTSANITTATTGGWIALNRKT